MNFDDFKYHKNNWPEDNTERLLYFEKLKQQLLDELYSDETFRNYSAQYDETDIDRTMKSYINFKVQLIQNYELYAGYADKTKEMRYRQRAEETYDLILQKKLFNMQLLWRAEQLTIPGIQLSYDFLYWERHVKDLPYIEPVTEQELEVMKQFLRDQNYSNTTQSWLCAWQAYGDITEKNDDGLYELMPEWYDFYDSRIGTGVLLLLPDIRGAKEEFYLELNRTDARKKHEIAQKENPVQQPVRKQSLHIMYPNYQPLIEMFEKDEHFKILDMGYHNMHDKSKMEESDLDDEVYEAIELLKEADHQVYIPAGAHTWRQAIIKCAEQYINTIIADELDVIHEERTMLRSLNIGKEMPQTREIYQKDYDYYEKFVKTGRRLNGEPEDLDF